MLKSFIAANSHNQNNKALRKVITNNIVIIIIIIIIIIVSLTQPEVRECLLSFSTESVVFQVAFQKFNY